MAASLFLTTSCYDLDVFPEDKLAVETFFKTQSHADQAMMGVYSQLRSNYAFGLQPGLDCLGFVGVGFDTGGYGPVVQGAYSASDGIVSNKFKQLYEGVTRANIVLQNVDKCAMSDELKEQYKGEARFLRALYYFTLTDFFGGVPYYDESTIVAQEFMNMKKPRSSVDEVRGYVLADLTYAEEKLPTEWNKENKGRATKAAAQALKGKVLLYNKKYAEAKDCFTALITNTARYGKMELYPDYGGLFQPGGDESSENIFAIQNIGGVGQDFGMPLAFYLGNRATFGSCWNNCMASNRLVDSYECKDGKKFDWETLCPGYTTDLKKRQAFLYATLKGGKLDKRPANVQKLWDMYENRDPRMKASIILPYTKYNGWFKNQPHEVEFALLASQAQAQVKNGLIQTAKNAQCYLWRKFVPEANMDDAITNREHTPINFPLIRLADVYLMLAECWNELPNGQDEAVEYINKVRDRESVKMPHINNGDEWMKATTKEEVFARIRHERQVELAAEGWSFSDMRRWGLLEEVAGDCHFIDGKKFVTRVIAKKDYLWPIPQDEMYMNPNLKGDQNPGW